MTRDEILAAVRDRQSLQGANLWDANLWGANLQGASLQGASLQGASLWGANLRDANLRDANLRDANLWGANLRDANLRDANLRDASLQGASLRDANLQGADLGGASLQGVKDFPDSEIARRQIVPEMGAFEAFKKLQGGYIAHLRIPADAQRVGGITGRKCRAASAEVLAITARNGTARAVGISTHNDSFYYRVGEMVTPREAFNADPLIECASGIHFFLTRAEAAAYNG